MELLISAALLAILAAASIPLFANFTQTSRLDGAARQIAGDARNARSQAVMTGWQYQVIGFNGGGGGPNLNQYRLLARSSPTVPWPATTAAPFQNATQMAGQWVNISTLYPGIQLNPQDSTLTFSVVFDSRGMAISIAASFSPLQVTGSGATKALSVSTAGNIHIQ